MTIAGYTYGTSVVPRSPISLENFELMKKSTLFGEDDINALKMSYDVLKDQVESILDVWYGFVGSSPQLLQYFTNKADGKPNMDYLGGVRKRFGQWILDTAQAQYDQKWLDYQYEIGRRHHRVAKNTADKVPSVDHIHFRYLVCLIAPITITLKPFLAKKGHKAEDVEKMAAAWIKSVLLQVALWSQPYMSEKDF